MAFSRRVARGSFDERLAVPEATELGDLVEHLNAMAAGLEERDLELHRRQQALEEQTKQLVEASRAAGMAEVATGVLHNVGNVLNSVNVSAELIAEQLRGSGLANLQKAVALLEARQEDPTAARTSDGQRSKVLLYLAELSKRLVGDNEAMLGEVEQLRARLEHIKTIIASQQRFAKSTSVVERFSVGDLIRDAWAIVDSKQQTKSIERSIEWEGVDEVVTDRHLVLQILVNLIANAVDSLAASANVHKVLDVVARSNGDGRLRIDVRDNGMGVPAESATKIFAHGFTTKKNGHGFGLHNACNAAQALGGSLECQSAGAGRGALFTLDLPVRPPATKLVSGDRSPATGESAS
jgi:signal transduction histidine kinase